MVYSDNFIGPYLGMWCTFTFINSVVLRTDKVSEQLFQISKNFTITAEIHVRSLVNLIVKMRTDT